MTPSAARAKECGRSRRRVEDLRFVTGTGTYIDDLPAEGQLVGHVLRAPLAHARILGIDLTAASAMPGVVRIYTAADLLAEGIGPLPCVAAGIPSVDPIRVPPHHALAHERVRHVGEPVAFVVADSFEAARDTAEAIDVSYDDLPTAVLIEDAAAEGAEQIWPDAPGNVAFRYRRGDAAAVAGALARAAHVVTLELDNNRVVAAPLEPRGAIARYDAAEDRLLLTLSGASVHDIRDQLCADVFRVAPDRLHVVTPDVGGGFGPKNIPYPEYVPLLLAARDLRREIRWISDRSEDFLSTAQARANRTRASLALDAEGRFLALEVETLADMGAYLSALGPAIPTTSAANAMGGVYAIPAVHLAVTGIYTNTVPIDAYRGAGKPEANYLIERLVDLAARRLAIAPCELRRRNIVSSFPSVSGLGIAIERGAFAANLDRAATVSDAAGFPARREEAARRGRLAGRGLACFLETARGAPGEWARVRFEPGGDVSIAIGTQSNGQGHETTFPQIAADRLGLPLEAFRFVQGDTRSVAKGKGHGGARSLYQGGAALVAALDDLLAKARAIAARLLQASPEDLAFADGAFSTGRDSRRLTLGEIAEAASDPEQMGGGPAPGLSGEAETTLDAITFPNGCHVAEVEIDRETGEIALTRYCAVDDYGTLVNPLLTEGQLQGGIVQGIGQAICEHTAYDPASGQLIAGSFMDYRLPRAADIPDLEIVFQGVPSASNPLGVKGVGQAGAIAAPQTIVNAVVDALACLGVTHLDMPITSEAVWRALRSG
ncbi:xanthine dehydrogenase family protein molybdopterin-binding subunit [Enterovirga rhinocerotis]|uniref:Carbon-monoxide dehydrogenase large subunit n=1 Tax=Enterovirga rhinocerotis TaxID=1339210 RepID=A0A4R7BJC1_9HYPH|nr:xanthine dehydrogenase family protein molybdopterin-binding subunit [Enterovirga rhinocerotis]TDR84572.1 carbon-monoxide dehydrogenase large subunit [Enterovirga rhinocerotis]